MATYAIWDKQSPEEFQPRLQYVLEGLGVKRIAATILIFGEGQTVEGKITNHDTNLREALQRAREKGLRFNAAKFVDRVQSVVFVVASSALLVLDQMQIKQKRLRRCRHHVTEKLCSNF